MSGEDDEDEEGSLQRKKPIQKILVMLAGVFYECGNGNSYICSYNKPFWLYFI